MELQAAQAQKVSEVNEALKARNKQFDVACDEALVAEKCSEGSKDEISEYQAQIDDLYGENSQDRSLMESQQSPSVAKLVLPAVESAVAGIADKEGE